mmetsp:Transcript_20145/g.77121  ORF Transcript_20145/g.77121 Transcript_20145/m.77121 type:complete len:183 (+) Transcript_20145:63-611(+)
MANEGQILPKLVVFDLDYTVWEPEMYLSGGAPFRKCEKTGKVYDASGTRMRIFEGARVALQELAQDERFRDVKVGYASRTHYPEWAGECLELLEVADAGTLKEVGDLEEIYPGDKQTHFACFRKASGIAYEDMLFFDNERRNCTSVARLGVTCLCTPSGMTTAAWRQGLRDFHEAALARRSR